MILKNTIRTEVVCEDEKRYSLKIEWNKDLPCAVVIMLSASQTNGICFDRSTNYCLSNLTRLGYGSCYIVNLFSSGEIGDNGDDENLKAIQHALSKADDVIYAAGTGRDCNKKVIERKNQVVELLKDSGKRLFCIADSEGKKFYHPLCPRVKEWVLAEITTIGGGCDKS